MNVDGFFRVFIAIPLILIANLTISFFCLGFQENSQTSLSSQPAKIDVNPSIESLVAQARNTERAWQQLQQHLSSELVNVSKSKLLRHQYQAQRVLEKKTFNQLTNLLAQREYTEHVKPQSITAKSNTVCKKLETEQQCIERAKRMALEDAAKQGASFYVQANSTQLSSRSESNNKLDVEQTFTEQVTMKASAHILQFELLGQQIDTNKVTKEKQAKVKLKALVAANRNSQYLQQLQDKYRSELQAYLSKPMKSQTHAKVVSVDNHIDIRLVNLPSGSFILGSENGDKVETPKLKQEVKSFFLAESEVTQKLYYECIKELKCASETQLADNLYLPIVNISWQQINNQFLPWLNAKTGERFRLPTEIEWEYAAKFDDAGKNDICSYANINASECKVSSAAVDQVAQYKSDLLGLYDLAGNVAEWTSSCWQARHMKRSKLSISNCKSAVIKGGSWYQNAYHARASARAGRDTNDMLDTLGFRLALDK